MYKDLNGKVAVITGAGGILCGNISKALAHFGVKVAIFDISTEAAETAASSITAENGDAIAIQCDSLDKASVAAAIDTVIKKYGQIDILINGAGGSRKECTATPEFSFFDMLTTDISNVVALNYMSAVIPSQVVGAIFAERKAGVILNISSIGGISPLTNSIAYCSGKAATNNFTQWLAVYMAKNYSPNIRVNAIAPGFVLTKQNHFMMVDENGGMTERAKSVVANVPMGRFGQPEEIVGAAVWLVSDSASFVTGVIIPVDGGYTAFSGV